MSRSGLLGPAATTSAPFPTRREVVLLSLLLLILCLWPKTYQHFSDVVVNEDGPLVDEAYDTSTQNASPSLFETHLSWIGGDVPETTVLQHSPGWTLFERLYVFNGTIFIVTSSPELIPEPMYITSSGSEIWNGEEWVQRRLPSEKDIRIVTPYEARGIFSTDSASRIPGASFISTDANQFIKHYYHFAAELLFGFWRTYTALDPFIPDDGQTNLPPPRRLVFREVETGDWRDYAEMNQWVLRGAFPGIGLEFKSDWEERAEIALPYVYDRVVLGDRAASYNSEAYLQHWRFTASAFDGTAGNMNWWQPLRKAVLEYSGVSPSLIRGAVTPEAQKNEKYVITYISRQEWGRRMLRQADHEKLVKELDKLRDRYGYEVNVVSMDKLTHMEQMELAARTTVMIGVHGNGLTNLLWMRPNPRSTVIEIFYPQGFATDYEFTTRALGMKHYGVWNNRTLTKPGTPARQQYPEGFQGNEIPVDGAVVAKLVHERLAREEESEK